MANRTFKSFAQALAMHDAGALIKWQDTYTNGAWHEFNGVVDRQKLERYSFAVYKVVGRKRNTMNTTPNNPPDATPRTNAPKSIEEALINLIHSAWAEAVFSTQSGADVAFSASRTARQLEKLIKLKS